MKTQTNESSVRLRMDAELPSPFGLSAEEITERSRYPFSKSSSHVKRLEELLTCFSITMDRHAAGALFDMTQQLADHLMITGSRLQPSLHEKLAYCASLGLDSAPTEDQHPEDVALQIHGVQRSIQDLLAEEHDVRDFVELGLSN